MAATLNLKDNFLGSGTKSVRSPRLRIMGEDIKDFSQIGLNILLVGKPGSGKTNALAQLVLAGYKLFIVSTDAGGDNGINTIKAQVIAAGKDLEYLRAHLRWVHVDIGDQVGEGRSALLEFLKDLRKEGAFGEFTPDVLVWEGLSNYQANYIVDEFDADDGSVDNFKQWGKISTATVRDLEYFFKIPVPYRIVTCQEGQKSVKVKVGVDAQGKPIMEDRRVDTGGAAIKTGALRSVLAAFDLVILLNTDADGKKIYSIDSKKDGEGKKRVNLPEVMPPDFMKVWIETNKQLGIFE